MEFLNYESIIKNIKAFVSTRYTAEVTYKYKLKGTVSILSSQPPCTFAIARFRTVPLKPLSDQ